MLLIAWDENGNKGHFLYYCPHLLIYLLIHLIDNFLLSTNYVLSSIFCSNLRICSWEQDRHNPSHCGETYIQINNKHNKQENWDSGKCQEYHKHKQQSVWGTTLDSVGGVGHLD